MVRRSWLILFCIGLSCPLIMAQSMGVPSGPYQPDAFTSILLHFDEGQGDRIADAGEFGLNVSLTGTKWAEGKFGKAIDCHGGGAVVRFHPALKPDTEMTIEAWVRLDKPSDDLQRIAYRSGVYGLYVQVKSTDVVFYVSADGLWESIRAPIPTGTWVHIGGVYDGKSMYLTINGERKAEKAKSGRLSESRGTLEIGGEVAAARRFFQGAIDEVRVSNIARKRFDPNERLAFSTTTDVRAIPVPEDPLRIVVPTLGIGKVAAPPKIDGKLDDAVWKDATRIALNDAKFGGKITQRTKAWVAYDDRNLYVAARCAEARMKRLKTEVNEHDGPVWSDDCIEIFAKPNPRESTYYHIAVNAIGTVCDMSCPKSDRTWESKTRVGVALDKREWTVEVAIPFDVFGAAPKQGDRWRFNIGREEKHLQEVSSWAPVSGSFHSPGKFGWLEFAEKPTPPEEKGTVRLQGLVLDEQGDRVQGLAISTQLGLVRTDPFGMFKLDGLRPGPTQIVISSPRYEPTAYEINLKNPIERVKLPPLREVDPNKLDVAVPPNDRGYRVYAVQPLDDLDPAALPPEKNGDRPDVRSVPIFSIKAFAARGEYEPFGAAIFASRKLTNVKLSLSDLRGPGGSTLGGDRTDLRLVKRYLCRVHYSRPPEDAVFVSRYLLRPTPFDMAPNTFRRVHVIVKVPDGASPGMYRGALHIAPANAPAVDMPIEFEVLPITLQKPKKNYSFYYRSVRPQGASDEEYEAIIRQELADIRAHGANRALWRPRIGYRKEGDQIVVDYDDVRKYIGILREFGFEPPYIVWTGLERLARIVGSEESEEFQQIGEKALRGLVDLAKKEGWGEVAVSHMDEVFGRDRFDRYIRLTKVVRRVPGLRMYITFHNQPSPKVDEYLKAIDPYVDIRCYHGHSMDMRLASGQSFDALAEELKKAGDEAWCYYNPRGVEITPEWGRLCNGFWIWLTPVTTHCPWAYNAYRGDPLTDKDGFDFGYAFPVKGEIVATRLYEGYREGIDDERYLSTLESLIEQRKNNPKYAETVKQAQAFLDGLRKELLSLPLEVKQSALVRAISEKYNGDDYSRWRRTCADYIGKLER